MKKLTRDQLVDYQTWAEQKPALFADMQAIKAARRIHAGPHLTFLFENVQTIRWQVQEMMRVEQIVREKDILHELKTYNEVLGNDGELGAVLLIEIADEADRDVKLRAWLDLPRHLYIEVEGGERVRAIFDERQIGTDRVSSVQYIRFPVGNAAPIAVGSDLEQHTVHADLTAEQKAALKSDLASV